MTTGIKRVKINKIGGSGVNNRNALANCTSLRVQLSDGYPLQLNINNRIEYSNYFLYEVDVVNPPNTLDGNVDDYEVFSATKNPGVLTTTSSVQWLSYYPGGAAGLSPPDYSGWNTPPTMPSKDSFINDVNNESYYQFGMTPNVELFTSTITVLMKNTTPKDIQFYVVWQADSNDGQGWQFWGVNWTIHTVPAGTTVPQMFQSNLAMTGSGNMPNL